MKQTTADIDHPHQRKSDRTRERLLDRAEELFIERGFAGTRVSDITAAAELTKPGFYYYYPNKHAVFTDVLKRYFGLQTAKVGAALALQDSLHNRLHAVLDGYLDNIEANPGMVRLLLREICSSSHEMERICGYIEPVLQLGEQLLGTVMPQTGPLSPRQFLLTAFSMSMGYFAYTPLLARLWHTDPLEKSALLERRTHLHEAVDALLDRFLNSGDAPRVS